MVHLPAQTFTSMLSYLPSFFDTKHTKLRKYLQFSPSLRPPPGKVYRNTALTQLFHCQSACLAFHVKIIILVSDMWFPKQFTSTGTGK